MAAVTIQAVAAVVATIVIAGVVVDIVVIVVAVTIAGTQVYIEYSAACLLAESVA